MARVVTEAVIEAATGDLVSAEVHYQIGHQHLDDYDEYWIPEFEALDHNNTGAVEDAHWNWRTKMEKALSSTVGIQCALTVDKRLQGLMIVDGLCRSKLEKGIRVPYLAYISTAPWNRGGRNSRQGYRHVGFILLKQAIAYSQEHGYAGRLALHSLPAAETWYKKLNFSEFGLEPPEFLRRFELDSHAAGELLLGQN